MGWLIVIMVWCAVSFGFSIEESFASGCGTIVYLEHATPSGDPWLPPDPGDEGSSSGADGNVKTCRVSLAGAEDWQHTLEVEPGTHFDIRAGINNKGDVRVNNAELRYYRSKKDQRNFDQDPNKYYGDDDDVDLEVGGQVIHEYKRDLEAPPNPGTYYIYIYINYDPDVREGNNISRDDDTEEYAKIVVKSPPPPPVVYSRQFLADVNGDGRADSISWYNTEAHPGEWWVAVSKTDGTFGDLKLWAAWVGYLSKNQFVADVNADGRADVIVYYDEPGRPGEWWVVVSTDDDTFGYLSMWAQWLGVGSKDQFVADVNGDHFCDAVMYYEDAGHPYGDWYVGLATANNTFAYTFSIWASWLGMGSKSRFLADVNADGRSDVVLFYDDAYHPGDWFVGLATVQGTFAYTGNYWARYIGQGSNKQFVADLNGDLFFDILVYYDQPPTRIGQWWGAVSTGTVFTNLALWADQAGSTSQTQLVGDANGDGKWDICMFYDTVSRPGEWWIDLANPSVSQFQYLSLWATYVGATSWW